MKVPPALQFLFPLPAAIVGAMHSGGVVPKDGVYALKQGEVVIPNRSSKNKKLVSDEILDSRGSAGASGGMRDRKAANVNPYYLSDGSVAPSQKDSQDRHPLESTGHNPGIKATMHEFKQGKLHSGSKKGPVVKSRKQAIAIAMSQAGKSNK